MAGKSGVTRSNTDELLFPYIEGVQMEGVSGVSRSIIDEIHSSDIIDEQWKIKWKKVKL